MFPNHYPIGLQTFHKIISHRYTLLLSLSLMLASYWLLDIKLATFFATHYDSSLHRFAQTITQFGKGGYYLATLAGILLINHFFIHNKRLTQSCLFLLACIIASGLLCDLLKIILSRARPVHLLHDQLYGLQWLQLKASFWSFPSGHATTITATMIGFALLRPRYWFVYLSIAITIALSRVIINAHYLSDIAAGILLGAYTALLLKHYWPSFTSSNVPVSYPKNTD